MNSVPVKLSLLGLPFLLGLPWPPAMSDKYSTPGPLSSEAVVFYSEEESSSCWKMQASAVVLLLIAAVVAVAVALPYPEDLRGEGFPVRVEEEVDDSDILTSEEGENGVRARRATCDLLSVSTAFGSLNHSACALHCLSKRKGFKGGRCQNGVCRCRK